MFEVEVQRGMALLDAYCETPNWVFKIDLGSLQMENTCKCIIGQLVGWDNLKYVLPEDQVSVDEYGEIDDLDLISTYGFDVDDYLIERVAYGNDGELHANSLEEGRKLYHQLEEDWIAAIKQRIDEGVKV